jgi:hypothetical protein
MQKRQNKAGPTIPAFIGVIDSFQIRRADFLALLAVSDDVECIFDHATALLYGDGIEANKETAKRRFLSIQQDPAAQFILKSQFKCPIKPIFRRRLTAKEEEFLRDEGLDPNQPPGVIGLDPEEPEDEGGGVIGEVKTAVMGVKELKGLFDAALSVLQIFQASSLTTDHAENPPEPRVERILDWSTKAVQKVSHALDVDVLTVTQSGLMMSVILLYLFIFPLFGLKRHATMLLAAVVASAIILPGGIVFGMRSWIGVGIWAGYLAVIFPATWYIGRAIMRSGKKFLHWLMLPFYIPGTIVGCCLAIIRITILGPKRGIFGTIMPWLTVLNLDSWEHFWARDYYYFDRAGNPLEDSEGNAIASTALSFLLLDALCFYILRTSVLFYIATAVLVLLFIVVVIVVCRRGFVLKMALQAFSFLLTWIFLKLISLVIMPTFEMITGEDGSTIPTVSKVVCVFFAIAFPFIVTCVVCYLTMRTSASFHPVFFRIWLQCTTGLSLICDQFRLGALWWPICDYLYQLLYSICACFLTPHWGLVLSAIFTLLVFLLRPSLHLADDIVLGGEPFVMIIYNAVLLSIDEGNNVPMWAVILVVILAFVPSAAGLVVVLCERGKNDTKDLMHDADHERQKRPQPVEFINEELTLAMFKEGIAEERRAFKFIRFFAEHDVEEVLLDHEDDIPEAGFANKILDTRSGAYIDVICGLGLTLGLFFLGLQFGQSIYEL